MSDIAIRVEGVGKQYRLGGTKERYSTLGDQIRKWTSLRSLLSRKSRGEKQPPFWALKDVSFEVKRGEVVGIIGRNGAGKSTLLKILSRITEPTEGEIDIHGRVGSLLEVGTGFHPELTGRENIYLNGAILGMRRSEVVRKFDEIVAFAEVEKFIDTSVKHYSSGMYTRLAFAVSAHLEPDILIVDEVLAVGDTQFQKKCLGKMGEVSKGGRTVLFVSHNMAAIRGLCNRCVCLATGKIILSGEPESTIASYMAMLNESTAASRDLSNHPGRWPSSIPTMTGITIVNKSGLPSTTIAVCESLTIHIDFVCPKSGPTAEGIRPVLGVVIKDQFGVLLTGINNRTIPGYWYHGGVKAGRISMTYPSVPLMPGLYYLDLYLGNDSSEVDAVGDALSFEMVATDIFGNGKLPPTSAGPVVLPAIWNLVQQV